jgi:hypothetical protein
MNMTTGAFTSLMIEWLHNWVVVGIGSVLTVVIPVGLNGRHWKEECGYCYNPGVMISICGRSLIPWIDGELVLYGAVYLRML